MTASLVRVSNLAPPGSDDARRAYGGRHQLMAAGMVHATNLSANPAFLTSFAMKTLRKGCRPYCNASRMQNTEPVATLVLLAVEGLEDSLLIILASFSAALRVVTTMVVFVLCGGGVARLGEWRWAYSIADALKNLEGEEEKVLGERKKRSASGGPKKKNEWGGSSLITRGTRERERATLHSRARQGFHTKTTRVIANVL
jgi:hypothetical protein